MRAIYHLPTALLVIFELNIVVHLTKLTRAEDSAGRREGEEGEKTNAGDNT